MKQLAGGRYCAAERGAFSADKEGGDEVLVQTGSQPVFPGNEPATAPHFRRKWYVYYELPVFPFCAHIVMPRLEK